VETPASSVSKVCRFCGATESRRWNGRECWDCTKKRIAKWKAQSPKCLRCALPRFKGRLCEQHYAEKKTSESQRYASNPAPRIASATSYYKRNRQKIAEKARRRYLADPETKRSQARAWAAANSERKAAVDRAWARANPEKCAVSRQAKRARKRNAPGLLTVEKWKARCAMFGDRCADCRDARFRLTMGHMIPLVRGGSNWPSNIIPQCASCNSCQGSKPWRRDAPWRKIVAGITSR
jgi:hypothetical protein